MSHQEVRTGNKTERFKHHVIFEDVELPPINTPAVFNDSATFNDPATFNDDADFNNPVNFDGSAQFNGPIFVSGSGVSSYPEQTVSATWSAPGWSDSLDVTISKIGNWVFGDFNCPESGNVTGAGTFKSPANLLPFAYRPLTDKSWPVIGHSDTQTSVALHYDTADGSFEFGLPNAALTASLDNLNLGQNQFERTTLMWRV